MSCSARSCSMRCASTGADSSTSRQHGCFPVDAGAPRAIPSTPRLSGWPAGTPPNEPVLSTGTSIPTLCVIALPRTCSKAESICAPSRCCWDIVTSKRPRFTCTSPTAISAQLPVRWMRSHCQHPENRYAAHSPAAAGDGRYCSLGRSFLCRAQPPLDQLATSEGPARDHTLPRRRAWRPSRSLLLTLPVDEFLRRFLLHLLPRGFMRIRNFGFLANRRRATLLPLCFHLLASSAVLCSNRIASCRSPLLVNPLELSRLWRLHARHRTALCNSTSAAFSTPHSPMCRMSLQLQPRSIYMLRHAHRPCVSSRPWPEQNHLHYYLRMSQDHAYPHSPWVATQPRSPEHQPCHPEHPRSPIENT
jgi:hypothetical protein